MEIYKGVTRLNKKSNKERSSIDNLMIAWATARGRLHPIRLLNYRLPNDWKGNTSMDSALNLLAYATIIDSSRGAKFNLQLLKKQNPNLEFEGNSKLDAEPLYLVAWDTLVDDQDIKNDCRRKIRNLFLGSLTSDLTDSQRVQLLYGLFSILGSQCTHEEHENGGAYLSNS